MNTKPCACGRTGCTVTRRLNEASREFGPRDEAPSEFAARKYARQSCRAWLMSQTAKAARDVRVPDTKPCACGRKGCLAKRHGYESAPLFARRRFATPGCAKLTLRRNGTFGPGRMNGGEPPMDWDELKIVRSMLEEGRTYREIGRVLDRDYSGIAKQAKRNGWRSVRLAHGRHPTLQELQA